MFHDASALLFRQGVIFPLVSCRLVWYSKEKGKPQKRLTLNNLQALHLYDVSRHYEMVAAVFCRPALFRVASLFPEIRKTLDLQGFQAETVGFEPTCRDEPTNAFRVRRVTAASLRLLILPPENQAAFFIILDFSAFVTWFSPSA